ncbi:MAG TPA: efflux transporter outer membrane subunit, partial [Terriglobales bacterium]|nr:efflux transporter outer membrane subunit [Terriglobales bacterium]
RRAIEAADAELLAAVASYDDVLVSLIAEVATSYTQIRILEERLALARDNVRVQQEGLRIAQARFEEGGTSELDVQQATTLLADTEASIPELQSQLRQSFDRLAVLLGTAPGLLPATLEPAAGIPSAPAAVVVGVPAELLRRRPDVRQAERQMAAESARIGASLANLFPRFELSGTIGLSAENAADLVRGSSLDAIGGPRFDWPILNYGRLINAVRAQDAIFQQAVMAYAATVLEAQREVEDALVAFLRGGERVQLLLRAVAAANRAVEIALIQYREGAADYTRVLTAQQSKLREDDALTSARGAVTLAVIALYRALGGGWEVRQGGDFINEDVQRQMEERSWWGALSDSERRQRTLRQVEADAEASSWWNPRRWWPQW